MTWLIIGICLTISFLFSGIEAGLLSLNRIRLRHQVDLKDPAAIVLDGLLKYPGRLLGTVLILTNLMNLTALVLAVNAVDDWFGAGGYLVIFAFALPVNLILVELLPKALFRRFPYRALALFATPLKITYALLSPLFVLSSFIARGVISANIEKTPGQILLAREELKDLATESEREGALSEVERQMIHNVVDFRSIKAKEVMVPMDQVVSVHQNTSYEELLKLARSSNQNRFPVLDHQGHVIGLVNILEALLDRQPNATAYTYLRRIVTASGEEPAYNLIRRLRAARLSLATVIEPGKGTIGIVSAEQIIDRLIKVSVQ